MFNETPRRYRLHRYFTFQIKGILGPVWEYPPGLKVREGNFFSILSTLRYCKNLYFSKLKVIHIGHFRNCE